MRISVSRMLCWLRCPRTFWYRYEAKVQSMITSSNLVFGRCIDETVNEFIQSVVDKSAFDGPAVFSAKWNKATNEIAMEFSSQHDEDSMLTMGQRMMEMFPQAWQDLDLIPLVDDQGNARVQEKLYANLAHDLDLLVIPDILAKRRKNGSVIAIDVKTSAMSHTEDQALLDDQLTAQQIGADANAKRLGIPQVDEVGFIDLLKRKWPTKSKGGGPKIETVIVPRRHDGMVKEFVEKAVWIYNQIGLGQYPRRAMQPFDSPCGICDYQGHCVHGSDEDIIWPEDKAA